MYLHFIRAVPQEISRKNQMEKHQMQESQMSAERSVLE
jgi:hypothetical protein